MSGALPFKAAASAGGRPWTFAAPRLDAQASAFALSTLVAILLALFTAFSLDLSRPVWAMLTAFILGQPHSGSVRSRSLYRLLGTLSGAAFAVLVTPALSPAPELLCLALAVWLGGCLFVSLLDRSPRSYVCMLAGYTATIIVFSNVEAPGGIFDTALARVEEISVGIACASLAHAILWPRELSPALQRRIAQVLGDADRWLAEALAGRGDAATERRRLAGDVTQLELLSHHLDFDTARLRPSRRRVRALLDQLSALTPLAASLEDRLQLLRGEGAMDPRLERLAADAEAWLRAGRAAPETAPETAPKTASALRAQAEALETEFQAGWPDWRGLVHASAAGRLAEVLATLADIRDRADRLQSRAELLPKSSRAILPLRSRRPLHRDAGLAALSGVVSAVSLLAACALWILTAWPEGGGAATFAAVGCCLFATQDDPTPSVRTLGLSVGVGIAVAAVYQFLVLPQVDGFVMLGAVLAPAILTIGYLQGQPAHNLRGLGLALGFGGGISPQSRYGADLAAFLNGNLALVLGVVLAFAVQRLVRVIDADWSGRRIARRGRRQVAVLAGSRDPADRGEWLSRGLDRLGLINARLPQDGGAAEALTDLRVGLDVIDLQRLRREAPPHLRQALDEVLDGVAKTFADPTSAAAAASVAREAVAPAIDRALWACAAEAEGEPRRLGLAALVDLRRNLGARGPDLAGEAA